MSSEERAILDVQAETDIYTDALMTRAVEAEVVRMVDRTRTVPHRPGQHHNPLFGLEHEAHAQVVQTELDVRAYVTKLVHKTAWMAEVSAIGNAVNAYVPYLGRRALMSNDEKIVDDAHAMYTRYLTQTEKERRNDADVRSAIVSAATRRYTSRLVTGAAEKYALSAEGRITYDVDKYRTLIEQDGCLEKEEIEDMVMAYGVERRAIEDATRTYSHVLVNSLAYAQEAAAITTSTDLYSSYLVRRATLSLEEKEVDDATSTYCHLLLNHGKEWARLQAVSEAKTARAAETYSALLVLGAAQKFAATDAGEVAREAECYCKKLLTNVCETQDFEDILAASHATDTYVENLLWKISLDMNETRQTYLKRQACAREVYEPVPNLGRKHAAPRIEGAVAFTDSERRALLKSLQTAIDQANSADARADEDIADDWTALVIQAELNSRVQRPTSPVRDKAREAGFRKLRELLPDTGDRGRYEYAFSQLWNARLGGALEDAIRALGYDMDTTDVIALLAPDVDRDAVIMARSLVCLNLGDALKQSAEIAALDEGERSTVFYSAGI
jgi:hypothetical protein